MLRISISRLSSWLAPLILICLAQPLLAAALPTISSFSPEYVYQGQYGVNYPVTINGTNFTSVTAVNIGGRPASFVVNSTAMITAYVPASASTNFIYVTTSGGRAYGSRPFTVKPIPAPTISSFTPTSAYVGETGRVITITGTNFMGVGSLVGYIKNTSVKIEGTTASISVVNDTSITATVPMNPLYLTYWIIVTTSSGTAYSQSNFIIKPIPAPTIASFTPMSAYTGETNRTITITGTNFTGTGELIPLIRVLDVKVGGTSASFNVVNDNTIITVMPVSVLYPIYWISVTTNGGTVYSQNNFTVKPIPAPTITSFTPSSGSVGETVYINGTNFMGSGALSGMITVSSVKIGGTEASFNVGSDTSLMAVVPANVAYPIYWISITSSGGMVYSGSIFTVKAATAPAITTFAPASGKVGDLVTITGTNFMGAMSVRFAGTAAVFTVVSTNSITANVPSGAVTGPISVTTPGGTGVSTGSFMVIQAPTISSITPSNGKVGDSVVITGTNFGESPVVQFNGTTVTSYPAISDSAITVLVPDGASTGKIAVTTLGGTVMSVDDFTVYQQPTNMVLTPASGIVGDVVTISGSGFTDVTGVSFNGTPASIFAVDSDTSITVTVPSGATTGLVSVTNPSYTATSTERFTVYQQPVISSFLPDSGIVGDVVHITGANFTDINEVEFNGAVVTPLAVDDTSITVTVPGGATTGMIGVSNPAYTASSTDRFTVYQQPTISSVQPDHAIVGERVTITGTNLADITGITFNNTAAVYFSVDSDTTITVTVPSGATTGKIVVRNPAYTAESANDFTVYQRPTITSFTPESGVPGDTVTISGTGFTGADIVSGVSFTNAMANIISLSDTSITVAVPQGAITGPITVTTPAGSTTSARSFTVYQMPTITSFTPESGLVGDRVTIAGTGFAGVREVLFAGIAANITSSSDTSITAFVPNLATTGLITVTTPAGSACSARNFTVYERPSISSFSPDRGAVGQVVTITGNTFVGVTRVIFNTASAITYTVNSETSITATVPNGATTGRISVSTRYGPATSATDFVINQSPTISSFTPTGGAVGIGVTINGTGLMGATEVHFGGIVQMSFTTVSDTTITTTVPSGAQSSPISVTTPSGTATSLNPFFVAPSITSFTPTIGPIGTVVTIYGTNFNGVGLVTFNGVTAAISSVTPTTIVATVPSGATSGPISVTSQGGVATSAANFVVQPYGVVEFWGKNGMGQGNLPAPNQNFTALSSGWNHVAGLKQDGSVVCWGYNNYGECDVPSPNQNFSEVSAGYYHTAGLKHDGSVVCWGWTLYGICTVPLPNENFISISTRNMHTVGLKSDGTVVCWGDNSYGQCVVPMPNQNFIAVSAGHSNTVGLKSDGSVVCWGLNNVGQCTVPAPNQGFIAVSGGANHSAGLKSDGSIVCWGWNGNDECTVPAPNQDFVAVSAGMGHTVGLKRNGSVVCWGTNTNGECNVPGPNSGFIAISAGASYTCAIKNP